MPAFWKQMSCENRHASVPIIDGHVAKAKTNEENSCPWRIENVLEVLKYVAFDDMLQFRGCYHTSKIDPSVFVEPETDKTVVIEIVSQEMLMPLDGIQRSMWMPSGEKQQGETMALFLGPVVGQVVRLPMLSLATSPILFHRGIV
jgi:hypothetical protein